MVVSTHSTKTVVLSVRGLLETYQAPSLAVHTGSAYYVCSWGSICFIKGLLHHTSQTSNNTSCANLQTIITAGLLDR